MASLVLIDKPIGITSSSVVIQFKKYFFEQYKISHGANISNSNITWSGFKIGHAGTLDPAASGLLILAVQSTRLLQYLSSDKQYEFTMLFGKQTDTADIEGKVIAQDNFDLSSYSKMEIENKLAQFIGPMKQIPNKFSAIKINGKRAYELARNDINFQMHERQVEVYNLKLLAIDGNSLKISVNVSTGFYIRTFAEDIAKSFNTIAMTSQLRRTYANGFDINELAEENKSIEFKVMDQIITTKYKIVSLNCFKKYYQNLTLAAQSLAKLGMGGSVQANQLPNLFDNIYACVDEQENFRGMAKLIGGVIFPLYMVKN